MFAECRLCWNIYTFVWSTRLILIDTEDQVEAVRRVCLQNVDYVEIFILLYEQQDYRVQSMSADNPSTHNVQIV